MPHVLEEIREQPRVLRALARSCGAELRRAGSGARRIRLVGCGDMSLAGGAAAWLVPAPRVAALNAMDLRWVAPRLGPGDLLVAASASGRTPRTLEAARLARRSGTRVLALTDNQGSPLTQEADATVILGTSPQEALGRLPYAGYHHHVPQTKSFTAVLLGELEVLLGAAGERGASAEVADVLEAALPDLEAAAARAAAECIPGVERVAVLGSGPHRPLACYGAAKLIEFAVPALGQCIEEFNHLEAFLSGPGTLLVVLCPDAASSGRVAELLGPWTRLGSTVVLIGEGPPDGGVSPVRIPLPRARPVPRAFLVATALQLLALHAARLLGRDVDRWVGGVREEAINAFSQEAVRGSRVLDAPPDPD